MNFMNPIYYMIKTFSSISYVCIVISVIGIIKTIIDKDNIKNSDFFKGLGNCSDNIMIIIRIATIVMVTSIVLYSPFSQQILRINDINLKPTGTYCYAVDIDGKKYPAKIQKTNDEEKEYLYYIQEIYNYPVELACYDEDPVKINETQTAITYDDEERDVFITLLNEHYPTDEFEEDSYITPFYIITFMLKFSAVAFLYLIYETEHKKYKSKGSDTIE